MQGFYPYTYLTPVTTHPLTILENYRKNRLRGAYCHFGLQGMTTPARLKRPLRKRRRWRL